MYGLLIGVSYDVVLLAERLLGGAVVKHLLDFTAALAWGVGFVCCLIAYGDGSFRGYWLVSTLTGIVIYLITIHRVLHPVLLFITKIFHKKPVKRPKK